MKNSSIIPIFTKPFIYAVLFTVLAFISCSIENAVDISKTIPDTIAIGVRQVTVSPDGRVEIHAEMVEVFIEEDYSVFHRAKAVEFNPEGEKRLEGGADRIEAEGSGDGKAEGNVFVNNLKDDSSLKADLLLLDDENRLLTGKGSVQVDLGDGMGVTGETFEADIARKTYSFTEGIEGTIEYEEEETPNE
ncbi:MAG: hypothetical protein B0D92_05700 [Spirochaeta sp. LUC14_002_19_P3]|nr:MAG: hypothetical protein B0D92_05700 [Spirochaeta sp. LUC14_002_19_P3]